MCSALAAQSLHSNLDMAHHVVVEWNRNEKLPKAREQRRMMSNIHKIHPTEECHTAKTLKVLSTERTEYSGSKCHIPAITVTFELNTSTLRLGRRGISGFRSIAAADICCALFGNRFYNPKTPSDIRSPLIVTLLPSCRPYRTFRSIGVGLHPFGRREYIMKYTPDCYIEYRAYYMEYWWKKYIGEFDLIVWLRKILSCMQCKNHKNKLFLHVSIVVFLFD